MSMTRVIKLLVGQFAGIVLSLTFSAVDLKFHLIRKFSIGKVHHQVAHVFKRVAKHLTGGLTGRLLYGGYDGGHLAEEQLYAVASLTSAGLKSLYHSRRQLLV